MTNFIASPYYLLVKDITYLLITLGGVVIACMGLSTWRRQLKGNVEHETARRLYKAVLKLRDAMGCVRNPMIWPSEFTEAEAKYPKENKETTNAIYLARWEKIIEALSGLQVEQLEGEVLWGEEVIEKLKPMKECVKKLQLTISNLLSPAELRKPFKDISEVAYENITDKEADLFSQEINAAIVVISDFLRPKYNFPK